MIQRPPLTMTSWMIAMGGVLMLCLPGLYTLKRFTIGMDVQEIRCLPEDSRFYLIDHWALEPHRGDRIAFRTDERMMPFFNEKTVMVKVIVGVPGDQIALVDDELRVNDIAVTKAIPQDIKGPMRQGAWLKPKDLHPGEWVVIGSHPLSFDSRYWGIVDQAHLIGTAYAFPF